MTEQEGLRQIGGLNAFPALDSDAIENPLQWIATEGLGCSSECLRWSSRLPAALRFRRRARTEGPEEVARAAIPNVEPVADDGKPHRMPAIEQLAVFDGLMNAKVGRNRGCATAVPAGAVARLGLEAHLARCGV